jgi:transcriptional regulator with XRE-family HTH domain
MSQERPTYIGENIARIRKDLGISQTELAERMGLYQKAVSRWENQERVPDGYDLVSLAEAMGCTVDDLTTKKAPGD